jgi:hypothetical protein
MFKRRADQYDFRGVYMMFPKKKWHTKTKPSFVKTLDTVFSQYIRLLYANSSGICFCITCGLPHPWKEIDCGHFMTRQHRATRWDERNCHPQCKWCNRFLGGEQYKHGLALDKIHGEGTAYLLKSLSAMKAKYSDLWFGWQINKYRIRLKALKKVRGL